MASQAQRKWAAAGRAAAAADPKKYASVRIKSSVDRARKKTEKATKAVAATGKEYRGPTPEQIAAGTLEVGVPTTKHREETRRVATAKDLPTIRTKKPTDVRVTEEYRGPTPEQIAAGTLEVGVPDTTHRIKTRATALLREDIKTGEIPKELIALKTHEKTLSLMEEALTPDIHPIVRGEYKGTREEYQKYQRQFGEYETEYKDYSKEYERVKDIYEARQKAAEELKPKEIAEAPPVHEILPVREVEPPTLKPPLLKGLEKYAVAPPVEVRRLPPVTNGVIPLYEPVQEIKKRIIEGYGLGIGEPLDVKTKKISKDVLPFEKYTTAPIWKLSTEMASKYEEFREKAQKGIVEMPGGVVGQILTPARKIGVGITRTPTIIMETMGLLPIGAEFAIREPAVAAEMAPIGVGLMAGGIVTGIRERPFETTGEFIGMMLGPKVITKVIPAPKIPTLLHVPTKYKTPTLPTGLTPGKIIKFRAGAKVAAALEKVSPPIKKPLDFTQVKALGKAGKDVEAWIKAHPEQETVVGGSAAARTQLKGARQPGDIDINVVDVNKAASELYEIVSKVHGKDKTKVSFLPEHGSAKVKVKTNGWHDAVDIHSSIEVGAPLRTGFPYKVQKPIRIEGIDYVPLGELIQRKAESVLQSRRIGTIGPEEWRLKDVADFEKFVSEALEHKFTKAQTSKMFAEYKKAKVKKLEEEMVEYKFHAVYGPEPYQIRAAAVKYEKLPLSVRLSTSALVTGVSAYPREYKPPDKDIKIPITYPPYKLMEIPRKPYTLFGETQYKPIKKPPYAPPYALPYAPTYAPPYEALPKALYKPPPSIIPPKISDEPIKPKKFYMPKADKKDKKKKARKVKEFEVLYTNPIASPFAVPSTGKIKKNK